MASNFNISIHRKSNNLHIRLMGDFDKSSAYKLLTALHENCDGASKVFINTTCLKNIQPFERNAFQKSLALLPRQNIPLVFTGLNADKIVR